MKNSWICTRVENSCKKLILLKLSPAAYLKAAEGLEGEAETSGIHGTELWALAIGAAVAILLLLILLALLCFTYR